jgi:hypothetical protein
MCLIEQSLSSRPSVWLFFVTSRFVRREKSFCDRSFSLNCQIYINIKNEKKNNYLKYLNQHNNVCIKSETWI